MSRTKAAKAKARQAAKSRALQATRAKVEAARDETPAQRYSPADSRRGRFPSLRRVRDIALTFGAIAGVVCILFAAMALVFDVQPVVFRSGSMSPAINTGALGFSKTAAADDLKVGDIVTVKTGAGIRVTHRIENVTLAHGKATLILRGDANSVADDHAYVVKSADRVFFDIPKAGYVVNAVSGPAGIFAGGLLVGLLLLTAYGPNSRPNKPALRHAWGVGVAALAIGMTATNTGATQQTQAYYTDNATAASGNFTMFKVYPPGGRDGETGLLCMDTNNNKEVTISWLRAVGDGYTFQAKVTAQTPETPVANSYIPSIVLNPSSASITITGQELLNTWSVNTALNLTLTATLNGMTASATSVPFRLVTDQGNSKKVVCN